MSKASTKSTVMSDETLNAICGIFEKPKEPLPKRAMPAEWMKPYFYPWPVIRFDQPANQSHGYSNPLKSVHWEAP